MDTPNFDTNGIFSGMSLKATVTLKADADCVVLCDGKELCRLKGNLPTQTYVAEGPHLFTFIHSKNRKAMVERQVKCTAEDNNIICITGLAASSLRNQSFFAKILNKITTWRSSILQTDINSVTFDSEDFYYFEDFYYINGHTFVDLALPSGLLWATNNIGAATAADDGEYFAWGETESKSYYSWATYKYGKSSDYMTKYNTTDGKTTLDKEDDAAYVNWGASCRMPTYEEFSELLNSKNCIWTWTKMTNSFGASINGYKVTSTKNGNSIFFPASGCRSNGIVSLYNRDGYCWSNTIYSSYQRAYFLYLYCAYYGQSGYYRFDGRPIRPVANVTSHKDPTKK